MHRSAPFRMEKRLFLSNLQRGGARGGAGIFPFESLNLCFSDGVFKGAHAPWVFVGFLGFQRKNPIAQQTAAFELFELLRPIQRSGNSSSATCVSI
jgi:hypothetical protein